MLPRERSRSRDTRHPNTRGGGDISINDNSGRAHTESGGGDIRQSVRRFHGSVAVEMFPITDANLRGGGEGSNRRTRSCANGTARLNSAGNGPARARGRAVGVGGMGGDESNRRPTVERPRDPWRHAFSFVLLPGAESAQITRAFTAIELAGRFWEAEAALDGALDVVDMAGRWREQTQVNGGVAHAQAIVWEARAVNVAVEAGITYAITLRARNDAWQGLWDSGNLQRS